MKEVRVPLVEQHPHELPAAYPASLEELVKLPSGRELWIRPLVPDDAAALAAEFAEADEATIYARFFTPSFELNDERLRYLTEIDYQHHVALAAMTAEGDHSHGAAIGRYVERSADDVEFAIVVKEEFRRQGVATLLLQRLAAAAAAAGYKTMSGTYLAGNAAIARLLDKAGFIVTSDEEDGLITVSAPLATAAGHLPAR